MLQCERPQRLHKDIVMPEGLFLVKNLYKGNLVFYWVNNKGKKVSPLASNQAEAEDWWKSYMFSQYENAERRQVVRDRRSLHSTREIVQSRKGQSTISRGRRVTDQPISVDIDLFQKKLDEETSDL